MKEIISPLTGNKSTVILKSILASEIIQKSKRALNIDVSYLFKGTEKIFVVKCIESGYEFYYPFHISGDDAFYGKISEKEWYYNPWRWEHEYCLTHIKDGMKILEVGAGSGFFLKKINTVFKKIESVGLELNSKAVSKGINIGVNIIEQSIEKHALIKPAYYNFICSFQVMEHISDVHSYILSQIKCLKQGGTLVIAVPNNESFIKDMTLDAGVLNMPPHHMGLWDKKSLTYLSKLFDLKLEKIIIEPLQETAYDTYQYTVIRNIFFKNDFFTKNFWRLYCKLHLQNLFRGLVKKKASKITGHTIIAVFKKN